MPYTLDESKKQSSVTLSTASSELCAAVEGIRAVLTARIVLFEIRRLKPATDKDAFMAIKLRMDYEAALRSMKSEGFLAGANKHLTVRYFWVKEMVDRSQLDIDFICSNQNIADVCTKILGPQAMANCWHLLGMMFVNP
jgi:hypothetical protein